MFSETGSFYYSSTGDITNTLQRQFYQSETSKANLPLWQRVDDRFFWNRHMLQDLIQNGSPAADRWINPVIQGFIQIESCCLDYDEEELVWNIEKRPHEYKVALISRRSRDRAGTRYKRRGLDESGKCANYVETEQIVEYTQHCLSFVQVRGSVPVFWSQPGYKYKPPPRLDKDESETQVAFENHFTEELSIYHRQAIINLVEQSGKEKLLADAYLRHVLNYNNPNLTYISFDFHEHCRGLQFDNVNILVSRIQDIIRDMWYCWINKDGLMCFQQGVFRINCMDCLDRTNIVQTALAKTVLEAQFTKLNLTLRPGILPNTCQTLLQNMWANNGDELSRQYAGTAALKSDFTRTGERRFKGVVLDGYNSANRYYLNAFRDGFRQACFDILQGKQPNDKDMESLGEDIIAPLSSVLPTGAPTYFTNLALTQEINLISTVLAFSSYYIGRFKDSYRQATIDVMLGKSISNAMFGFTSDSDSENLREDEFTWLICQGEHVKQYIEDCRKMLVANDQFFIGGWGLIDADPTYGDSTKQEMDTILILTADSYYVADYDDESDRVTKYQKVALKEITKIELGPEPTIFKSKFICLRINYQLNNISGYFHMLRPALTRLFNNTVIPIKSDEEAVDSLKSILESFVSTLYDAGITVPIYQGKLEKIQSNAPFQETKKSPFGGIVDRKRSSSITICESQSDVEPEMTTELIQIKSNEDKTKSVKSEESNTNTDLKKEAKFFDFQSQTVSLRSLLSKSSNDLATSTSELVAKSSVPATVSVPIAPLDWKPTPSPRRSLSPGVSPTPKYSLLLETTSADSEADTKDTYSTVIHMISHEKLSEIDEESSKDDITLDYTSLDIETTSDEDETFMQVPTTSRVASTCQLSPPLSPLSQDYVVPGFSQFVRRFHTFSATVGGFRLPVCGDLPTVFEDPIAAAQINEKRNNCMTRIIEL